MLIPTQTIICVVGKQGLSPSTVMLLFALRGRDSDSLRPARSGVRTTVGGGRFSVSVKIGPNTHPVSVQKVPGLISGGRPIISVWNLRTLYSTEVMSRHKNDPFHTVNRRPWPLTGANEATVKLIGIIKWFNQYDAFVEWYLFCSSVKLVYGSSSRHCKSVIVFRCSYWNY